MRNPDLDSTSFWTAKAREITPQELASARERAPLTAASIDLAREQLAAEREPGEWLRAAAAEHWRPGAADQGSTVTMTEVYGDEGWRPRWPGPPTQPRLRSRRPR